MPASVKARLLNGARARAEEFERTLSRFAIERLLYRLGECGARERCVLKGASLLSVWLTKPYRATRDIDVLAFGAADDEAIRALLEEICVVPCPEDGLRFDLTDLQIDPIRAAETYAGHRARFLAYLGTARISLQVDFAFGDAVGEFESINYPSMLDDLPAPRLRAYSREASVAEKFEAMVKLETRNSRMKDFHDIWALAGAFPFDGAMLRSSIVACFDRRGTPWTAELPRVLAPAFYAESELRNRWAAYLEGSGLITLPPAQFETIGERVTQFLGPVRGSIISARAFEASWPPAGPWKAAS